MRFSPSATLAATLYLLVIGVSQTQAAEELDPLQGLWTVSAAEQRGKAFDAIKGGTLKISGDTFELKTAAGNRIDGKLTVNNGSSPRQIDFLLTNGAKWEGIYALTGTVFRLNYVEMADGAERPQVFATNAETAGTVIVMRKAETP